MFNRKKFNFDDFTENAFRKCIQTVKLKGFNFISFNEYQKAGKNCLWRHDIDFSPHRGLALAKIEQEEGIHANYFIWLHSDFYNLLELEIVEIINRIKNLGHSIGLHFDSGFYGNAIASKDGLEKKLEVEKKILEDIFGFEIHSFSFHNPVVASNFSVDDEKLAGMINVYNKELQNSYTYCSDSFCYWRFRRLMDVIEDPETKRLHALTHPECWTESPMSPYARILRAFDGRKKKSQKKYEMRSIKVGRKLIK